MKPVGIKCVALNSGLEAGPAGQWLKSYDPDGMGGRGHAVWTADPSEAMTFLDVGAAVKCWQQQSEKAPTRDDGRPNKPLTAYTVEVIPLP